jgi:dienelactone hydrolase
MTVALLNLDYRRKNCDVLYVSITIIAVVFLFAMLVSSLSDSTLDHHKVTDVYAQPYLEMVKNRNLTIDLGNGLKTNATLTYPAVGKGPFPGVLLISGAAPGRPFTPELAPYLSERGFAVLQYDKRGTNGVNNTIIDPNIWGNMTVNNLIDDAEKALNVLIQQPEVDPKRASIVGHSEGTVITPRVAIDNSTNVKNIVLMGTIAQNAEKLLYYQAVDLPLRYATQVLDKNHTGFVSIQQMAKDPMPFKFIVPMYAALTNNTKAITDSLFEKFGATDHVSIQNQIRPELLKSYENVTALNISDMTALNTKCNNISGCPVWHKSHQMLIPNLSIIGNVSNSTGILLLNGENDSNVPVQQAFLLQQRLTDVNHPDHTLITYPNLGHGFSPSSQPGPIEPYVLADIYSWLAAHSGLSQYIPASTSKLAANTSSSSGG